MKKYIYWSVNILRLFCGIIMIFFNFVDIDGIFTDPITYERVYTGEFLGARRYDSLLHLISHLWILLFLAYHYVVFVILHLTKLKSNVILTWLIRIADVIIIIYTGYLVSSPFL